MTQRTIEITSPIFVPEERLTAPVDPLALFGADRPLALEIGCGIGDFIIQMALRRPDLNFLATDIYNKGCLKTCRKVEAAGLANVRVVRQEARYLLDRYLPEEKLAAVFVNCPDPWPKKRHRRRRLVNAEFLQYLLRFLRPGGEFFFSSDFEDYAAEVAAALALLPGWGNCLAAPCALQLPDYPLSKYMRRFLDLDQPVYFLHWRKEEEGVATPAPPAGPGCSLPWGSAANG